MIAITVITKTMMAMKLMVVVTMTMVVTLPRITMVMMADDDAFCLFVS